jgi:hypothetical protein
MTAAEVSFAFDFFMERLATNGAPGFDDVQKSTVINDAMEQLITQTYQGLTKPYGFEETEKRIEDLGDLVKYKTYTAFTPGFLPNSSTVQLPNSLVDGNGSPDLGGQPFGPTNFNDVAWYIIYEACTTNQLECNSLTDYTNPKVKEISHQELDSLLRDPFNKPGATTQVFRNRYETRKIALITDGTFTITDYTIGYIKKPQPINLSTNTSFSNIPDHFQREIIKKAVSLSLESLGDPRYQTNKAELNTIE